FRCGALGHFSLQGGVGVGQDAVGGGKLGGAAAYPLANDRVTGLQEGDQQGGQDGDGPAGGALASDRGGGRQFEVVGGGCGDDQPAARAEGNGFDVGGLEVVADRVAIDLGGGARVVGGVQNGEGHVARVGVHP